MRIDNKTGKCKVWKGIPKREVVEMKGKRKRKNSGEGTDLV